MNTKTAEERAAERFQMPEKSNIDFHWYDDECIKVNRKRFGYATCIREEVEPLEAEVVKLRALVQELTKAGDAMRAEADDAMETLRAMDGTGDPSFGQAAKRLKKSIKSWDAAVRSGFVPTHTTEG